MTPKSFYTFFVMQKIYKIVYVPSNGNWNRGDRTWGNAGKKMKGSTQNHAFISRFCQIMCMQRGEQFNTTTLEIHHCYFDGDDDDDDDDGDGSGGGGDDEM